MLLVSSEEVVLAKMRILCKNGFKLVVQQQSDSWIIVRVFSKIVSCDEMAESVRAEAKRLGNQASSQFFDVSAESFPIIADSIREYSMAFRGTLN